MEIIVIYFVWMVLNCVLASRRGRSQLNWFLIQLLVPFAGPPLATIYLLFLPRLPGGVTRQCPFCAEHVKRDAVKCKHCHSNLPTGSVQDFLNAATAAQT